MHSYRLTVPLGPVGGVPEDGVTVAVRLTDWPKLDGFGVLVSTVVVGAWLTVWVSVVDELMAKLVGSVAVKVAKTAWDPTESDEGRVRGQAARSRSQRGLGRPWSCTRRPGTPRRGWPGSCTGRRSRSRPG